MYIQTEKGEGVVAYNVMNLTPAEMQVINTMDRKIADVLVSHREDFKGKKLYLSDEDLFSLRGILFTFARFAPATNLNTFTATKDELVKDFNEFSCEAE